MKNSTAQIHRHKTAMTRYAMSRPMDMVIAAGLVDERTEIFDYGCGLGSDVRLLQEREIAATGWDPVHRPDVPKQAADIVNLGYVVNVIEDPEERADVLRDAWGLAREILVVSARLTNDLGSAEFATYSDGCLTKSNTFQKFYEQHELRDWIDTVLGEASIAVAPGVFFVFCEDERRQAFAAARYRRRTGAPRIRKSDALYAEHHELLDQLAAFFTARGRLPAQQELPVHDELSSIFGSIKRAYAVLRNVTDPVEWEDVTEARHQDFLIYVALSRFDGRPTFTRLPQDLQLDVKAFCGRYTRACKEADALLFSLGELATISAACVFADVGKVTGNALYCHKSAIDELPPLLRLYEGCARGFVGEIPGANIVKLHRRKPQVSYLCYPEFDTDPHPALDESVVVKLGKQRYSYRDYRDNPNPPILHRKELFVGDDYPGREKFERLTRQEERFGLYDTDAVIGFRQHWRDHLIRNGVALRGHRVVRKKQ